MNEYKLENGILLTPAGSCTMGSEVILPQLIQEMIDEIACLQAEVKDLKNSIDGPQGYRDQISGLGGYEGRHNADLNEIARLNKRLAAAETKTDREKFLEKELFAANALLDRQHGLYVGMNVEVTPEYKFYSDWKTSKIGIVSIEYVSEDQLEITVRDENGMEFDGFQIDDLRPLTAPQEGEG